MPDTTTTVQVSSDALNSLKVAVLARHGKLRGALRDEIGIAFRERAARIESAGK